MVSFTIEQGAREALTAERAEQLLASLPSDVTFVKLSGKSFGDGSAAVAGEKLAAAHETLTSLDLSDIIASRPEDEAKRALETIATSLSVCRSVRSLDLSDNALGAKGVRAVHDLLAASTTLECVKFCNNGLAGDACALIADALMPVAGSLRELHFHNNLSENAGARALAPLVEAAGHTLEVMRFSSLRVGREGCVRMCEALTPALRNNLRQLNVSDNSFGKEGAEALASALSEAPRLEVVNIRDCLLEDSGVALAIEKLANGAPNLRKIDVSGNECGKRTAAALGSLLKKAGKLEEILAEDNEFGNKGAVLIADALEEAQQLRVLNLKCCEIGGRGALSIANAAAKCESIGEHGVLLDGNAIPLVVVEEIETVLGERLGELEDNDEDGEDEEEDDSDESESDDEDGKES